MTASIGILAFGSLIDKPGREIAEVMVGRKTGVMTPFGIEFARSSRTRGGAPSLVPITEGGSPVRGSILLLNTSEADANDRLWRRETDRVGQGGRYVARRNPGPDTLIIDRYEDFEGTPVVIAARFQANISPLNAERLAELAIESARRERSGRDGITYLMDAKRNGIVTPLSPAYEATILHRTGAASLEEALRRVQA